MDLYQAILFAGCLSLVNGTLSRLWPLNNVSYTSEVIVNSPNQDNTADCGLLFTPDSASGLPFAAVQFDGTSGLDIILHISEVIAEDHSFSGWFKSNGNAASIFHFKAEDATAPLQELKLVFHSSELHATRKIIEMGVEKTENVSSFGSSLSSNTWYYMSFGIDRGNGKFKVQIDDSLIIDQDLNFVNNIDVTLPGILRIGKTFDDSSPVLTGSATCFSFHIKDHQPKIADTKTQCGIPYPVNSYTECRDRNIGYYGRYSGATNLLEQMYTSNQCSVLKCALSCLRNILCKFIQYDDTMEGCKTCVLLRNGFGNYNPSYGQVYKLDYYE